MVMPFRSTMMRQISYWLAPFGQCFSHCTGGIGPSRCYQSGDVPLSLLQSIFIIAAATGKPIYLWGYATCRGQFRSGDRAIAAASKLATRMTLSPSMMTVLSPRSQRFFGRDNVRVDSPIPQWPIPVNSLSMPVPWVPWQSSSSNISAKAAQAADPTPPIATCPIAA